MPRRHLVGWKRPMSIQKALTILELLVVISIIGILVALLIPAVQSVREAGRRITCTNHFRQVSLAVLNYASAHNDRLPPYFSTTHESHLRGPSWRVGIGPFLEESQFHTRYDFDEPYYSPQNVRVLNSFVPVVFQCPSTSSYPRTVDIPSVGLKTHGARDSNVPFLIASEHRANTRLTPGGWYGEAGRPMSILSTENTSSIDG